MKLRTIANAAAVVALGLAAWTSIKAQGPMYDRVDVSLPYTVTIGQRTLQPGNYVIQQLRSTAGDSRVLLIYGDNGMKFETSAMTIPVLDINTARDTRVMLHHFGNDYYFDKVWIQGKDYGYEFPLPDSVKSREKEQMQPVSVAANYSSVPSTNAETTTGKQTTEQAATTTQTTNQPATTQPETTASQTTNQAMTNPPATNGQATSQAATNGQATSQAATNRQTSMAQNTPQATNNQSSVPDNSANREMQDTTTSTNTPSSMPHTSAGWLMMLLGGGALSGAGMTLRRKR
jgi:hypothetical protein